MLWKVLPLFLYLTSRSGAAPYLRSQFSPGPLIAAVPPLSLVQRILEQRVVRVLDALLQPPLLPRHSGSGPPSAAAEGTLGYLRTLAAAYERTQELAGQLARVGCGDLDCEALADSLFSSAREDYLEHEQASLAQLFEAKMAEARAGGADGGVKKGGPGALSVGVVTDMLRWSEEAGSRCLLLTRDPGQLAWNVKHVFTTTVQQVRRSRPPGRAPRNLRRVPGPELEDRTGLLDPVGRV